MFDIPADFHKSAKLISYGYNNYRYYRGDFNLIVFAVTLHFMEFFHSKF